MELLTKENPKTIKGRKHGYETVILHLAPHTSAGIQTEAGKLFNACPYAGNCIDPCLNYAGHGGMGDPETNQVQIARRKRTKLYVQNRDLFFELPGDEITRAIKRANRKGLKLAIRPNGTSDIPAIAKWVCDNFPDQQVYDYTKIPYPWKRVRETIISLSLGRATTGRHAKMPSPTGSMWHSPTWAKCRTNSGDTK